MYRKKVNTAGHDAPTSVHICCRSAQPLLDEQPHSAGNIPCTHNADVSQLKLILLAHTPWWDNTLLQRQVVGTRSSTEGAQGCLFKQPKAHESEATGVATSLSHFL